MTAEAASVLVTILSIAVPPVGLAAAGISLLLFLATLYCGIRSNRAYKLHAEYVKLDL